MLLTSARQVVKFMKIECIVQKQLFPYLLNPKRFTAHFFLTCPWWANSNSPTSSFLSQAKSYWRPTWPKTYSLSSVSFSKWMIEVGSIDSIHGWQYSEVGNHFIPTWLCINQRYKCKNVSWLSFWRETKKSTLTLQDLTIFPLTIWQSIRKWMNWRKVNVDLDLISKLASSARGSRSFRVFNQNSLIRDVIP